MTKVSSTRKTRNSLRACGFCGECGKRPLAGTWGCTVCILKRDSRRYFRTNKHWEDLLNLFESQHCKCPYTGTPLIIGVNAELDHIIPLSKGGINHISNVQWVSTAINKIKSNHSVDEFTTIMDQTCEGWQRYRSYTQGCYDEKDT